MTQRLSPFFVVGQTYADRLGEYRVISLKDNRIVFEYTDGRRSEGNARQKKLIYKNILLEKRSPRPIQTRNSLRSYHQNAHGFTQSDTFPIIAEIIEHLFEESRAYVTHDAIVDRLLKHPEAAAILSYCPKNESTEWWASNMVSWFSQAFRVGRSDWNNRFERKKIDGKWAYMGTPSPPKKSGEWEPGISQNVVAVVKPSSATIPSTTDSTPKLKERLHTQCPWGCGLVREDRLQRHIYRMHSANSPLLKERTNSVLLKKLLKKRRKIEVPSPKSTDAVWRSVSGGRPESNRRKH
jgi:hypothetical protein